MLENNNISNRILQTTSNRVEESLNNDLPSPVGGYSPPHREMLKRKRNNSSPSFRSSSPPLPTIAWYLWIYNPAETTTRDHIKTAVVRIDRSTQTSTIYIDLVKKLGLKPSSITGLMGKGAEGMLFDVGWVGKGGDGGIIQCTPSEDPHYDLHLGADFLLYYSSALFNERPRKAPNGIGRTLDSSFRPVDPAKARNFFKKGAVLRILWPQPSPYGKSQPAGIFKVDGWTEKVHYKITWFVIAQVFKAHCIGLPVHTYDGRATTKPGVDASSHAALVHVDRCQMLLPNETLEKDPFHMIPETGIEPDKASRIDFARPSTIEYNVKVMKVGRIVARDVGRLLDYFLSSVAKADTKMILDSPVYGTWPGLTDETKTGKMVDGCMLSHQASFDGEAEKVEEIAEHSGGVSTTSKKRERFKLFMSRDQTRFKA